jgi:hypothetical protein
MRLGKEEPDKDKPRPILSYLPQRIGRSVYLAENDDLLLSVPIEGVRVMDEVPQDLGVVGGGHDEGLLGPVVQDQLVRELAVLERSLAAPVGVDVGDLPDLYRLLGVLLTQGQPPLRRGKTRHPLPTRPRAANACATHETSTKAKLGGP